MKKLHKIFATALVLFSTEAFADFDRENKTYLDLDIGWGSGGVSRKFIASIPNGAEILTSASKDNQGIMANFGMGTYLLRELRVGINAIYSPKIRGKTEPIVIAATNLPNLTGVSNGSKVGEKIEQMVLGGFVNVGYDFLNRSNIIPFVGLGYGIIRSEFKQSIVDASGQSVRKTDTQTRQSMQLELGIGYHVTQAMDIVGKFTMFPRGLSKKKDVTLQLDTNAYSTIKQDNLRILSLGVRYTF
jgi:opacity protein-like surface antigen